MKDDKLLEEWLAASAEVEGLEFKEAKQQINSATLVKYCAALANEGGGYVVLGITNEAPRSVVGTQSFSTTSSLNKIKSQIKNKLGIRVDTLELAHPDGRVLAFRVPSRPKGHAIACDGAYLMRCGEELCDMTPDRLKEIFSEDAQEWFSLLAVERASASDVVNLLDTQSYFDLLGQPYPTTQEAVMLRLEGEGLLVSSTRGWDVTNLAAVLLAKRLSDFPSSIERKAPRFIAYDGGNKLRTRNEITGTKGIAAGFSGLVDYVYSSAPQNRLIEEVVRKEVSMFPKQAVRELIANALVHQDFQVSGTSVMIEMYADRLEVSNPGIPPISTDRFIDEYNSRNELLADFMRRMGICEEKGSGIDKVVHAAEVFQLPPPDFRAGESRTTAILFAHQEFQLMSKADRIRACYQHCCLQYVSNQRMSNKSLRRRFGLGDSASENSTASQVISAARDAELIKADESGSKAPRYARYLPWWA